MKPLPGRHTSDSDELAATQPGWTTLNGVHNCDVTSSPPERSALPRPNQLVEDRPRPRANFGRGPTAASASSSFAAPSCGSSTPCGRSSPGTATAMQSASGAMWGQSPAWRDRQISPFPDGRYVNHATGLIDCRQREEALADFHVFEPGEWRRGQGLLAELTETSFRHVLSAMRWLLESGEIHSAWSGNSRPGRCQVHSSCPRLRSTRTPNWCCARWRSCCACCQCSRAGDTAGRWPRASWLSVMVWSKR